MTKQIKKEKRKNFKLLGKKRKFKYYKFHSLSYNQLCYLLKGKNIKLNINAIKEYIKIKENIVKGDFIGAFPNGDFLTERYDENNLSFLKYTLYSKSFKYKLIFNEVRENRFFLIGRNYGGSFNEQYIKIYIFYDNNTKYKIIQKIVFPQKFPHDVIFPFSFINNNELYFFLKCFSYDKSKITIYKLKQIKALNDKNEFNTENIFEENVTISFDFSFIWFAQKNNNELLFFKEEGDMFDLVIYNFEEKQIKNHKRFNLIKKDNARVANYVNKVIKNRYLIYTNDNLLFIIDVEKMEITAIKELDNIIYIYIANDDIIWTVENRYLNKSNLKKSRYNYLKQFLLDINSLELIKIGERGVINNFVKNILPFINNKILLFVEKRKVELLNS